MHFYLQLSFLYQSKCAYTVDTRSVGFVQTVCIGARMGNASFGIGVLAQVALQLPLDGLSGNQDLKQAIYHLQMTAIKSCKERKRGKTQPNPTLSSVTRRERRAEGKPGSHSRVPPSPLCLLGSWDPLLGRFSSATRWRPARCWINEFN